jgi:hypothetical protein
VQRRREDQWPSTVARSGGLAIKPNFGEHSMYDPAALDNGRG